MTQLGTYVGDPSNTNSSQQAAATSLWDQFISDLGETPTMMLTYAYYTIPLSAWVASQQTAAASWEATPWLAGVTPVIGLPMAVAGDNGDTDFKAIASGSWDSVFLGIFQAWANAGYTTFDIRPGWEMNGTWYPWSLTTANAADFVAAFQHIATLAHDFTGAKISVIWNPNVGEYGPDVPVSAYYPGNAYVDQIGLDTYGSPLGWDGSPTATSSGPADFELSTALAFAQANDKPFCLPEVGGTDTTFPASLASVVAASGDTISFVAIWDQGTTSSGASLVWSGSSAEGAAWASAYNEIAGAPQGLSSAAVTLGSGHDSLVLGIAEDAWEGNAQYTVSVNGVQIGGTQTATASHGAGQSQAVTILGDWGDGTHTVSVDFLNDAYGGSPSADRNLYVTSASYDGIIDSSDTLTLLNSGTQTLTVGTAAPGTTVVGSGNDTVVLQMNEDYYLGNATFVVSVDGTQIGGTQTVVASHTAGQTQTFDIEGNWGTGQHTVAVDFTNDAYGGNSVADRNLYVTGASYDGITDSNDTLTLLNSGTQSLTVGSAATGGTTTTGATTTPVTLGSGHDSLVLGIAEDAWEGNAEYTVSVNGVQIGGTQTATASNAAGQSQAVTVLGDWGDGTHTVSVDFLNDAYGGSPSEDRNLYVTSASYDGITDSSDTLALYNGGTQTLTVGTAAPGTTVVGSGKDTVSLQMNEDYYLGNATFVVSVDGTQVGGTQTVVASHTAGQTQTFSIEGNWGTGQHTVAVDFNNDAYGGNSIDDRNLYVTGASYDGKTDANDTLNLYSNGTQTLTVG